MGLSGKRDDEAEHMRLEKLKKQELEARKPGRPRKDFTEVIEERAADRIEYLTDKALDAIERGMKSANEKVAVDASAKYLKTFYHPTQKLDVTGMDKNELHIHLQQSQSQLNESDQQLLGEFLDILKDASDSEKEYIDAQVVEELEDPKEA